MAKTDQELRDYMNSIKSLPISGAISASMINEELGRPANQELSLDDPDARALAGVPSGQISYSDFYGKSSLTIIAVGEGSGFIGNIYINNGTGWRLIDHGVAQVTWNGVGYGNGVWVAVGEDLVNGLIYSSIDNGETWKLRATTIDGMEDCYYSDDLAQWVAVGAQGQIFTSVDNGETWITAPTKPASSTILQVYWGNGNWVATAGRLGIAAEIWQSSDGYTWTLRFSQNLTFDQFYGVFYDATEGWTVMGFNGEVVKSTDALNWTLNVWSIGVTYYLRKRSDGLHIGGGSSGSWRTSSNTQNWTHNSLSTHDYFGIACVTDGTYMCGSGGVIYYDAGNTGIWDLQLTAGDQLNAIASTNPII